MIDERISSQNCLKCTLRCPKGVQNGSKMGPKRDPKCDENTHVRVQKVSKSHRKSMLEPKPDQGTEKTWKSSVFFPMI